MCPAAGTLESWQDFPSGNVRALALDDDAAITSVTMQDGRRFTFRREAFGTPDSWTLCGRNGRECQPLRHPRGSVRRYDEVLGAIGPVRASSETGAAACAARDDGRVVCWRFDDDRAPAEVPVVTDARGLVIDFGSHESDSSACAWAGDGRAWCWGDDRYGQLGDGRQALDQLASVTLPAP